MENQLKFDLAARTPAKQQLNALVAWLKGRKGWTKAKDITAALGLTERRIRSLASKSDALIISAPGSPGYKHVANCTIDEINAVCNKLQHQAIEMDKRRSNILRRYHKRRSNILRRYHKRRSA